jgi:hypothetical protein
MITSLRQSLASPNDDGAEDDGEGGETEVTSWVPVERVGLV